MADSRDKSEGPAFCGLRDNDGRPPPNPAKGRISVFTEVEMAIVRKKEMPASVAPERFQTQQCFVTLLAPVLAWPFEAALRLPTGGLDGSAANGLAPPPSSPVIHPALVFVKIIDLFLHRFRRHSRW